MSNMECLKIPNLFHLILLSLLVSKEILAFSVPNPFASVQVTRRGTIQNIVSTTLGLPIASNFLNPLVSNALDIDLLDSQAKRFRNAPAFAIINADTGVPFMILRNTGTASAYFFTTYEAALLVLDDARKDAQDKDLVTKQTWNDARISAVTLEFALKLSKAKPKAVAQNNQKYDTVYDIIPTLKALDDAGKIDKSGLYTEQGRAPLFYMKEFKIAPAVEGGEQRIPVFFAKDELLAAWAKKYPDSSVPPVKVVDLVDTFAAMVGAPTSGSVDTDVVKNLYLVASPESKKKAIELEKSRGQVPAYKTGEMVAVGGR